jgi:hypothetical protein
MVEPMVACVTVGSAAPGVSVSFGSAGDPSRVRRTVGAAVGRVVAEEDAAADVSTGVAVTVVVSEGDADADAPDAAGDGLWALTIATPTTTTATSAARRYQARRVMRIEA